MSKHEPIPLIVPDSNFEENRQTDDPRYRYFIGYLILISTWILFIVSINSMFEIWRFMISPLNVEGTQKLYNTLKSLFETVDYYVVSLWCAYVVMWWWAVASWLGLKLFRQSKGLQT